MSLILKLLCRSHLVGVVALPSLIALMIKSVQYYKCIIAAMCVRACNCEESACSKPIPNFDCVLTSECDQENSREVSEDDRDALSKH